jgi:hypothetical protein
MRWNQWNFIRAPGVGWPLHFMALRLAQNPLMRGEFPLRNPRA